MVFGNLGRMLAAAAGERDGLVLAAVFESGCGGPQPAVLAAVECCKLTGTDQVARTLNQEPSG